MALIEIRDDPRALSSCRWHGGVATSELVTVPAMGHTFAMGILITSSLCRFQCRVSRTTARRTVRACRQIAILLIRVNASGWSVKIIVHCKYLLLLCQVWIFGDLASARATIVFIDWL